MKLEAGSPTASKLYWVVATAVLLGAAGWFLYDWKIGYPAENMEEARKHLSMDASEDPAITAEFTREDFQALKAADPNGLPPLERINQTLGQPRKQETRPDGAVAHLYVSRYGMAIAEVRGGRVTAFNWHPFKHTQAQIQTQFYFALLLLAAALFVAYKLIRTLTMRVTLDDERMTYGGTRVAYADMTGFSGFSPKGWVDLNYRAGGSTRKLRLDNQRVEKFEEIVSTIAAKANIENPLPGRTTAAADETPEA